jgi:hypothetical protein
MREGADADVMQMRGDVRHEVRQVRQSMYGVLITKHCRINGKSMADTLSESGSDEPCA